MAEVSGEAVAAKTLDTKPTSESEINVQVQELVAMFKKLNPLAKEFFPSSYPNHQNSFYFLNNGQLSPNNFADTNKPSGNDFYPNNRRVIIIPIWSLLSGFWVLYHCVNDCLDCLCVLEEWVIFVGFAYLLFLFLWVFFFFLGVMWIELRVWIGRLMGFWIFIFF